MDLPIDHFRLLGVSPAADAQQVLRMLAQRLDRLPHEGFTAETLRAREELLRASADLLSDEERRAAYEAELTSLTQADDPVVPALDVPSSKEMGGMVLLLEGGQPLEVFDLACRCLQPPQAPALGSGREADLALLAGLSARAGAAELREERHYEAAAGVLQQGLQLLQRMGQLPELREQLHHDLEQLTPYRVLDLLSRDLGALEERREGMALLEQLVHRRGGLEGDGDPSFGFAEFQAFFKQIRSYLTVQEQIDLFGRWAEQGSTAADFLATTALAASGFAQRKPDRIAQARDRLLASDRGGIEPLLANLHLLLGEVDLAKARFSGGADDELKAWAARQSGDPLGQVCAYCRDWLRRDVLPGYRDLEADPQPDLDAYFSDRDVVAYIDREDRRHGRSGGPSILRPSTPPPPSPGHGLDGGLASAGAGLGLAATPTGASGFGQGFGGGGAPLFPGGDPFAPGGTPPGWLEPQETEEEEDDDGDARHGDGDEVPLRWSLPQWSLPRLRLRGRPGGPWLIGAVATALLLVLAGSWLLRQRPKPAQEQPPAPAAAEKPPASDAAAAVAIPLRMAAPEAAQIRALLEAWLASKAAVLADQNPPHELERIAREGPVRQLRRERARDRARGQRQEIDVKVNDLAITERSPIRIAARAELAYSDTRRNAEGTEVEKTAPTTLRNIYVFGRDGDTWRLAATTAAD